MPTYRFIVSRFDTNSNGKAYYDVEFFTDYSLALISYQSQVDINIKSNEKYSNKVINEIVDDISHDFKYDLDDRDQIIIYLTQLNGEYPAYRAYQDGLWKRPIGFELRQIDLEVLNSLFVSAPHRTY